MEGLFLLFFISVVNSADEIHTNQQCQQKNIQSSLAVREDYICDSFCQKNNADSHMRCADLFQICRQVIFINVFQMTFGIKRRLTKEGKNASGKKVNAC